jgi:DNA (cytosine-5)-methyltransferase 1
VSVTGLRFYEFFAGAGLARLGLGPAWSCAWANDIDQKKARIYRANFGDDHLLVRDVAKVRADELPPGVDLAWASFPCQDLSLAGWRRGMSAERSGTFWAFWRLMRDLYDRGDRPPLIVIENVVGLLYGDNFTGLCEALAALDLQFGSLLIDAKHFLPQSRPRVFVVAIDAGVSCADFVDDWPERSPWFIKPAWTAYAALPLTLRDRWRWWRLPAPTAAVPSLDELIEDDPTGVGWHTLAETDHLLAMMTDRNMAKIRRALARRGRSVGLLYRRTRDQQRAEVRFDGVAGCLRTPQGGSSRQTVVVVEDGRVRTRLLSPREAARLMGAPDTFQLPGSYNDAYRAMGDAVAVPVVDWLARNLLTPLAWRRLATTVSTSNGQRSIEDSLLAASRRTAETLAARWGSLRA